MRSRSTGRPFALSGEWVQRSFMASQGAPNTNDAGLDGTRLADPFGRLDRPRTGSPSMLRTFVVLGCFFLSWQLFRVPEQNFTASDGAFLAALAIMLFTGRATTAPFGRFTAFWLLGVILLLAGLLLGSIVSDQAMRWGLVASQYLIALVIIPMIFFSLRREDLDRAAMAFVYGVAVSQVIGILALKFVGYHALTPYVGRTIVLGNDRVGAMTAEPNSNGAVCVFALIILAHALMERRANPLIAAIAAGIIIAGMVFSASATSFLALAVGALLLILVSWQVKLMYAGMIVVLGAIFYIGAGGALPEVFVQRVAEAIVNLDLTQAGTFESRLSLIGEAWRNADANLFVGLGVDRYREISLHGAPVHNLWLLALNEGGILAFAGIFLLVACLFASAASIGLRDRVGAAVCFATLAVLLIYTMSLPHMYGRNWFGPPLLIFAMVMVPRLLASPGHNIDLSGRPQRGIAPLAGHAP
jgi:O-antigen ligase